MAAMAPGNGQGQLEGKLMSSMFAAWAAITTSPRWGGGMMAAGEAHTAAAAAGRSPCI